MLRLGVSALGAFWLDEVLGGAVGGMLRLRSWYSGEVVATGPWLPADARDVISWLGYSLGGVATLDAFAASLPPRDREACFEDEGLADELC